MSKDHNPKNEIISDFAFVLSFLVIFILTGLYKLIRYFTHGEFEVADPLIFEISGMILLMMFVHRHTKKRST